MYLRSDARTRYFEVRPAAQLGLVLVAAGFAAWTAFATASVFDRAIDDSAADTRLAAMTEAYETRIAALHGERARLETELTGARLRADAITARLTEKQDALFDARQALGDSDAERAALDARLDAALAEAETEARRATLAGTELARLELALARREAEASGLDSTLGTVTAVFADVIAARDAALARSGSLSERVAELETDVARWESRQERMLSELEQAARASLTALDGVFERTDLDLEEILRGTRADYSGTGGPLEPLGEEEIGAIPVATDPDVRIASLMSDLERVNLMRIAANRLPFGRPVTATVRLTSTFGMRRSRLHSGVDLAAPRGTPIFSTAEGVVTFAGRQSGYGIVVKIRHAFGFETIYAHMNAARVEVGQYVNRGDRIGDMGSTGRSTGSHLHYEVRIDGEAVNPSKFIEAARDVL